MELTQEQRQAVVEWVGAGASLAEVQRRLKEELGLTMTYMEARLLVLEIGAELQDKPEPAKDQVSADGMEEEDPYSEEFAEMEGAASEDGLAGGVSLEMDRVMAPGAMVSGNVTFSDGAKARWLIDQYGRFGLEPEQPGYRPSEEDLQDFQTKLRMELRRHGYG